MITIPVSKLKQSVLDEILTFAANNDNTFAAKYSLERGRETGFLHYHVIVYWKTVKAW